ncbi:unnamed protein product [Cercospora beticola]|nr:unnamed protein product [Cercospora beticola]
MALLSSRGRGLQDFYPPYFEIFDDPWNPDTNPNGYLNLGVAENTLMQPEMKKYIDQNIDHDPRRMNYGDGFFGSKQLNSAACKFLNKTFSPTTPLTSSHLIATAGVGNALEACAWALCERDDYILIGRPYWGSFKFMFGARAGVKIREVSFGSIDPFTLEAVSVYEKECEQARKEGKKVSALLLCTPHNPTGRCYSRDVMEAYLAACQRLGIHLISDEIYALCAWDNPKAPDTTRFTSVLSLNVEKFIDPSRVHVVWGTSKDFGVAGIRIGFLISQSNPEFLRSARSISLFNYPSSIADHVVAKLFGDEPFMEWYHAEHRARLATSYQFAVDFMEAQDIPYIHTHAGLFLMINLGAKMFRGMTDDEIHQKLKAQKVYIYSGKTFTYEEPGWFRLVFAHPVATLQEGFKRLLRASPQGKQKLPTTQLENLCIDENSCGQ